MFLISFFAFLQISNVAPHARGAFDPTVHLTPSDIAISRKLMKITLKWSKTIQSRDKTHVVMVPRLRSSILCPVSALQTAIAEYKPSPHDPLFQKRVNSQWQPLIESCTRKVLSKINVSMGYDRNHFTFHSFRRSGASLAYNSYMPIRNIKHHSSWMSDCVWTYIQENQKSTCAIALAFADVVDNS